MAPSCCLVGSACLEFSIENVLFSDTWHDREGAVSWRHRTPGHRRTRRLEDRMQPLPQLSGLASFALGDQLTVDGGEQLALSLSELGVGLQRLQDVHGRLLGRPGDGQVAQQSRQNARSEVQGRFEFGHDLGAWDGLALLPLPDRAVGQADGSRQGALGQAPLLAGMAQCLAERLALLVCCHRRPRSFGPDDLSGDLGRSMPYCLGERRVSLGGQLITLHIPPKELYACSVRSLSMT